MAKSVILIVQGEALIRLSAVHIVEDAGYSAVEAGNAEEAIALLKSRKDIKAVLTSVKMSGSMDGLKLAHAIRRRWPPIHLIVTSAHDLRDKLPANGRFVAKPYMAEHIVSALRDLFGTVPVLVDC